MTSNTNKYEDAFREAFELDASADLSALEYQSIPAWDSVGHMALIALLEASFDIMMEMDDIIDFSSFSFGKSTLRNYGVIFDE